MLLQSKINDITTSPYLTATPLAEQRVSKEQRRVIDNTIIFTIPWIIDAPAIIQSWNPTAMQVLKNTPR